MIYIFWCFSGDDYVRGMRYALHQAAAGRVVMSVDSTALLNQVREVQRHRASEREREREKERLPAPT